MLSFVPNYTTHLVNGIKNELTESSYIAFSTSLVPLAQRCIVKLVSPQPLHQLGRLYLEFVSIHLSKLFQSESPAMQSRAKTYCAIAWVNLKGNQQDNTTVNLWCTKPSALYKIQNLYVPHRPILHGVGSYDHIDGFHYSLKGLVQVLLFQL